ncbi:MAG TPA: Fic family protein [Acidimicrobiales bacterium]|nr:Fic family protein [Acidimicrobiales bacterium]
MTRYLTLSEYLWLAERVTGVDAGVFGRSGRIELADSALHAPQASFGGEEFYPDLLEKAAVLACRLSWNHPLPDGNKRSSWAALVLFLDLNNILWAPDPPDVDEAEQAMLAVAPHHVDEQWLTEWLRARTRPRD